MTENDILAVLIVAAATVKLTGIVLSHRRAQQAASRKAAKEAGNG
jgi:hypothetical protein